VFKECKRVLKDEGTMWVNLGDSYSGSGNGSGDVTGGSKYDSSLTDSQKMKNGSKPGRQSLQSKCLLNIPSRFAIAMTDELGLILRNNIIWHKNNCMPSSATDRFTVDFEDIMFFTKKKNYYFEQQFEKSVDPESYSGRRERKLTNHAKQDMKNFAQAGSFDENGTYKGIGKTYPNRNMRAVWNVNTSGSKDKHYAMYPEKLLVRMIEAGCPKGGIVLDPFGGSGTTGITAKKLQRNFINIELNPEYSEMAINKYHNTIGDLF
jgi:site-specific DNA-methyltransferase (adenine-specific)